ncbi:hypothetical protein MIMGU_mgv1a004333mg [Erythranthe guttata]|uniref:Anaphase-promoting complex subunit 4 WD40 domain-containing protein n=1 Tax=Erythranthe guttata TaxID=4155 RepID=A0A022Q747_ERYGU|nr:hypothetical protein MIMGU_mgv1a004333mg [Erythranthe guttata]
MLTEGEDIFFDASDHSLMMMSSSSLDYDIWSREPQSVRERRDSFLSRMGFVESESSCAVVDSDCSLMSERRKSNSEANCSVDYSDHDWLDDITLDVDDDDNEDDDEVDQNQIHVTDQVEREIKINQIEREIPAVDYEKKSKATRWLRYFAKKIKTANVSDKSNLRARIRMEPSRKRCTECTAVYFEQEIKAHNGLIRSMKFSPDGKYLASGGEDGVVCVYRVTTVDVTCQAGNCSYGRGQFIEKKKSIHPSSVIIPEKIFHIEQEPMHTFKGHTSDVLDLAWSTSNHLLSSSMDKTVRLWRAGSDKCLGVFDHSNYVTCVQFNPVDENHFISGSIDGKVRVWGIHKKRVEDWAHARDIVTAVCYQPNGKGFVVGSVSGTCRFYESTGDELHLNAEINMNGRRKSSGNRITGTQFLKNDSQRVMITSEDSKIRILDRLEVVRKYKGPAKSGSQTSASFTSSGNHIVSVGEDSRVYLWNYDDLSIKTAKQGAKSTRSCENFVSEGVSVVLPYIKHHLAGKDVEPCPKCFEEVRN